MRTVLSRTGLLVCAAVACVTPGAVAQSRDTFTLRQITVTAARVPTDAALTPAGVTVIHGDDLRARGILTVLEALRSVPGVQLTQAGSFGAQTSLFLRGGESDYVRFMIDGVPVNQPGGALDLANLSTDNVERIEIVRGPVSVLYGSDAVTGVVQVITRGAAAPRWALEAGGGSLGSASAAASAGTGGGRGSVSLSGSRFASDGVHLFNNRYRSATGSLRGELRPDELSNLTLILRHSDGVYHYPTDGSGNVVDANQFQANRHTTAGLGAARQLSGRFRARLALGYRESRDRIADAPDDAGDTTGLYAYRSAAAVRRTTAEATGDWYLAPAAIVTVGGAWERQSEQSNNAYDSEFGSDSGGVSVRRANRALFAQLVLHGSRASLQAGLRLDDNQAFGIFPTARIGATAALTGTTRLRLAWGTAFKEPTFLENYATGFTVGNPGLSPERSRSWELGVRQSFAGGRAALDVAWFDQRFRDMIQYSFVTANPGDPNFTNIAGANAHGLELELRAAPGEPLAVTLRYTMVRTEAVDSGFDGAGFALGERLLRRPTHTASLDLSLAATRWLRADLGVRRAGSRADLDFSGFPAARVELAPHTRVDASARAALSSAMALTVRAENLLDSRYLEVVGFPARGRVVMAGLSLGMRR